MRHCDTHGILTALDMSLTYLLTLCAHEQQGLLVAVLCVCVCVCVWLSVCGHISSVHLEKALSRQCRSKFVGFL